MFSRRLAFIALGAALITGVLAQACGPTNPCARVRCESPKTCNPGNGVCELPAGYDGGSGGGTATDGGLACNLGCTGATLCDPSTGRCVQCLTAAQCACPSPLCANNVCVADPSDAGVITPADTCESAPVAIACGPKTFDVDVSLANQTRNVTTACAPDAGGTDVMFGLTLGTASDVRVSVAAGPGGAQPVAALRTQCTTDVDLACVDSGGLQGIFRARRLQPGTYTVVLQGYDRSGSGPTLARVEVLPPTGSTNETCLQAQQLPLDGGTSRVDLVDADDDTQLACNLTPRSPDLFYKFTLSESADVIINATGTAPQQPVLALRSGGCRTPTERSCTASGTTTGRLIARRLPAGDYTVVVETPGPVTMGRIELTSTASAASIAPSNDTCALPRDVTLPAAGAEVSQLVDTSLGNDDAQAMCGGAGPDQVFRFSVLTAGTYTFTATPEAGSGGVPVLYLRKASCDAMTSEACVLAPGLNQPATFTATLSPDTYYLWVDATQPATSGRVTVTIRR